MQAIGRILALALALAAAAGMPAAGAATLYSQPLVLPNSDGGPFSFAGQQMADEFRLAEAGLLNSLLWYGDNPANSFPRSMSFTIRLFDDAGRQPEDAPFYSQAVTATVAPADAIVEVGAFVFQFSANLPGPVALQGGTDYWLSILDNSAHDPRTGFRWANGTSAGTGAPNVFRTGDGDPWNRLFAGDIRAQAAYDISGDRLVVPVPEPGTLTLIGLALAGGCLARRRSR
jgi:hypothetical protein